MSLRCLLRLSPVLLGFCLLVLGGCSDDDPVDTPPEPTVVVGLVPGGQVAAGVKVVAMDPDTNLPAGRPRVSGDDGRCVFPDLPAGGYRLVAFGGPGRFVVNCREMLLVGGKADGGGPLAPVGGVKNSPTLPPATILMGQLSAPGGLPRFSGQVVDAATGDPLEAAFVSTSPFLTGYGGATGTKDDVTLADGRFLVSGIVVAVDPVSGNLVQVEPLLVTCAGYRPRAYVHDFPHGDDNLDVSGVTIELERVQAQDTGALGGRLLLLGEPAAGVVVGLGAMGAGKSAVGLPGRTAVTDQDGEYLFTGLPGGVYFVHPGFLPHDGHVYVAQAATAGRTVTPDQETRSPDLMVVHEIDPTYPRNGEVFPDTRALGGFVWGEVPGATGYFVYLDRGLLGSSDVPHIELPEEMVLSGGAHVWSVQAHTDQDLIIGVIQTQGLFYLAETAAK